MNISMYLFSLVIIGLKLTHQSVASEATDNIDVIFDVTEILQDATGINSSIRMKEVLKSIAQMKLKKDKVNLYFEVGIVDSVKKLQAAVEALLEIRSNYPKLYPRFLVTVIDNILNPNRALHTHVERYYSKLIVFMVNQSKMFDGFSIEREPEIENCNNTKEVVFDLIKAIKSSRLSSNVSLQIGYTFNNSKSVCEIFHKLNPADFYIVNVTLRLHAQEFVESYGIFKENLHQKVSLFKNKLVYYHVGYSFDSDMKNQNYWGNKLYEYDMLLGLYLSEWMRQNRRVIQKFQSNHSIQNYRETTKWLTTELTVFVKNLPLQGKYNAEHMMAFPLSKRILLEDIANAGYTSLIIFNKQLTPMTTGSFPLNLRPLQVNVGMVEEKPYSKFMHNMLEKGKFVEGVKIVNTLFALDYKGSNPKNKQENGMNLFEKQINSKRKVNVTNLDFACGGWILYFDTHILCNDTCSKGLARLIKDHYTKNCPSDQTSAFVFKVRIEIKSAELEDVTKIVGWLKRFSAFVIARKGLEKTHPNIRVMLQIEAFFNDSIKIDLSADMYCCSKKEKMLQVYEAMLTWAAIYKFPVILELTIDDNKFDNPIAWKKLKVKGSGYGQMKRIMESEPLYVRRRHNKSVVFGDWTKGMYPCIEKAVNTSDIQALHFNHKYAGVTLNCNLKPGKNSTGHLELEMILVLALKKFYSIELVVQDDAQVKMLWDIVTDQSFKLNLKENKIFDKNIYLRISHESLENKLLHEIRDRLYKAKITAHIIQSLNIVESKAPGWYYENCTNLAYETMFNQKIDEVVANTEYLICNTESFPAENFDQVKLQDYLDSHLYLQTLLGNVYQNLKEIHFSLHPVSIGKSEEEQSGNLVMFLTDVSNYAQIYQIRYFLLQAFAPQDFFENETTFWKISNYSNLSDSSIYQDLQSTISKGKTWTPTISGFLGYEEDEDMRSFFLGTEGMTLYIILGLVFATIIFAGCVLVRLQVTQRFMTKKEINEFLNGKQEVIFASIYGTGTSNRKQKYGIDFFDGLMHQKIYDLSKSDISLNTKNVLAKGKFSSVYQAKLHGDNTEVVVKVPNQDCTKNIFKGMVSEIKLLSYIGENNRNIVGFVGCNVNEVGNGVLWIITEYCSGGTLLDYLKSLKDCRSKRELLRFAHEIACGMEYIADQNVIHGTLSAKHVLLDQNGTCKIKGLGLVGKIKIFKTYIRNNERELLPWRWIAPEALRKLVFNPKSDTWSYGVTLWEIFSLGETPYSGVCWTTNFIQDVENGMRLAPPPLASAEIFDVLRECSEIMPGLRPDFTKLVECIISIIAQKSTNFLC